MRAADSLGRLFNVRSGEWRRLSLLYCMSLVVLTGLTWGDAIVQAAFLQRVGVQYLPWVFISSAACSVGALFIYTAFADRMSNTRLLIALLAISGAGIFLGLALLAGGLVGPAYLLLYLVLNVPLLDVYNVHWATYVNGFYDLRAAKRIVPVLGTSARLAGIIGGLSMPLLNRLLRPAAIIVLGVVALAVMAVLAAAMPRLLRERRAGRAGGPGHSQPPPAAIAPGQAAPGARPSAVPANLAEPAAGVRSRVKGFAGGYGANLLEGLRQIRRSPFLLSMALSTLSMTLLLALLNYRASAILQAELQTTVRISNFLGLLGGIANLVVLPIQLFLLSRLITRLGLGNASLVHPIASLAAAASLVAVPGLGTAALAYLDRTALRTAFRLPTDNLLYNAVPLRVKARTRAFVGGLVVPLGTIVGGLLLLSPLARTPWFLPAPILVLALAFVLAALLVRRTYGRALVALLEQEDYSSLTLQAPSLQAPSTLPAADTATLARLARKLRESRTLERATFMARLITEIGGEAAVPIVGQAALAATDARLRASLVDVLVAADVRRGGARELYAELLSDGDGQVRLSAIGGLEQIDGPRDSRYLEVAVRLLVDPEVAVRLRVLPALLGADDPGRRAAASGELQALLDAPDPRTRALALHIVGQTRALTFLQYVLRSLADGVDEVRLAAALAAEMLVEDELPAGDRDNLYQSLLTLLHDPIERARMAAVTILGRLSQDSGRAPPDMLAGLAAGRAGSSRLSPDGGREARATFAGLAELAASLADPSPEVRELAVEALVHAGPRAVRPVHKQLSAADPQLRKMAAVVLARIEPRKYAPLVRGPHVHANLLLIYRNLGCLHALAGCPGPAVPVLGCALLERNAALLDEIFYLLATIEDPASVNTIARSLRSPQPTLRANAAEALESLTAPQTAALIAPLFEEDLPPEQLLSLLKQNWDLSIPTAAAALRLLLSDAGDAWLRTLAAAALAELSEPAGPVSQAEIAELAGLAQADPDGGVRAEIRVPGTGTAAMGAAGRADGTGEREATALSLVEKLILVKEVPFFRGMTIDQLKALAAVCEEEQFPEGAHIFDPGNAAGAFYLVVRGRVGIEQENRTGTWARLAIIDARSCFGESNLFDDSPRSTAAVALRSTLALCLRREPLVELAGRRPDISMELVNVLAGRLREANDQIADLARSRPAKLHRLYDSLEDDVSSA